MRISVQSEDFDLGAELSTFGKTPNTGAVVTFSGVVRDVDDGLSVMEIEHYPGMTERALKEICTQAQMRWTLTDVLVIHRYGRLGPGEQIMMVATASRHRADAFAAAEFLMDFLKSRAPFWKKEATQQGSEWVCARQEDEAALERWSGASRDA